MRRSNAATLQDVALQAGVSAMTASVVLNGATSSTRVSQATHARVVEAAEKLSYRRNAVAHGLSRRRMESIGVVAAIDFGEVNLYFLEGLNGILEESAVHEQITTVYSISDWQKDEQKILQFCDSRVDGMILIAPYFTAEFNEKLPKHTPFVSMHSNYILQNSYNLSVDNEGGAYSIVRHLIEQGHRRIIHLAAPDNLLEAQLRLQGYRRALAEANIAYDANLVIAGEYSSRSGYSCITEMLQVRMPQPFPTAVFCASDTIASGCLDGLYNANLRVPEDISVVGFDDTLMARITSPPLTTVRQPFRKMGRRAVEVLIKMIRGEIDLAQPEQPSDRGTPADAENAMEIFQTELVLRKSVGPPKREV